MKDHFWWGPLQTPAKARQITGWAGWVFVVLGALLLLPVFFQQQPSMVPGTIFGALLFAAPGAFLLKDRSVPPAIFLLMLSLFLLASSLVFGVVLGRSGGIAGVAPMLFWSVVLTVLAWRAVVAARSLKAKVAEPQVANVFD